MTFLPFQWLTTSACPLEDDNQKFLQTAIFGCAFEPMNWATFLFGRIKSAAEENEETDEQNKHKQVSNNDNEKKV